MSESNSSNSKSKGVVKWFNDAKGFGFIEHTSGKDVFVHYSVIETDGFKTLKDGEEVVYEMKEGPKGYHALKVQRTQAPKTAVAPAEGEATANTESTETESLPEKTTSVETETAH